MAKSVMAVVDPGSRIPSTLEFFKVFLPNSSSQSMVYSLFCLLFNLSLFLEFHGDIEEMLLCYDMKC